MTFDEIADALGTTRQNVWLIYVSAMRKLKARPHSMQRLLETAGALDKERDSRQRPASVQ
jgi:transcriptional regulator